MVQDGFTISDERAVEMLARTVGFGSSEELRAQVLEAPSALQIARMQGYGPKDHRSGAVVRDLMAEHAKTGELRTALIRARDLIDGVAFVKNEGDSAPVLALLRDAIALLDARQGEPVEVEA